MDRRTAIRWMLAASSALALPLRAGGRAPSTSAADPAGGAGPPAAGYGTDPDLIRAYRRGDYWPLTLTPEQRGLVAALCDVILPADEGSPAASAVGVPDFIDEWISAPYPAQAADRPLLLEGLDWIATEARRRAGRGFRELDAAGQESLCAEIARPMEVGPGLARAAAFFNQFRALTVAAFYSTPEGMRDLGYVGNRPAASFEGPPPDVLARLGIDERERI